MIPVATQFLMPLDHDSIKSRTQDSSTSGLSAIILYFRHWLMSTQLENMDAVTLLLSRIVPEKHLGSISFQLLEIYLQFPAVILDFRMNTIWYVTASHDAFKPHPPQEFRWAFIIGICVSTCFVTNALKILHVKFIHFVQTQSMNQ
jgi:hypothetical protein